ncbi:MAG: ribosome biogenesis GTP-binding protein YihA/YsxC [Bacteroidetes bacterium]|nr:ribosome biogenesis GTP-binding protein YihA/YsxC [Bacteroidota bacterium]
MAHEIQQATFIQSAEDYRKLPAAVLPEYAFIGRSNVGKSSLINMLTNRKNLAKVSVTPGKTRLINHFLINNCWYLADLPGYGYARISKAVRETFAPLIMNYLKSRQNLLCTFLLIDSRLPAQKNDLEFMEWLGENELPFTILFTKADKLGKTVLGQHIDAYRTKLMDYWEELPPSIITSSQTSLGKEEILLFIEETNTIFDPKKIKL